MKIEVNIRKKYFFIIISTLLVLSGLFAVYAYKSNPANPAVFGHTANEIEGLTNSFTNIKVYTQSDTWPPTGVSVPAGTRIMVEVWGAGGGGSYYEELATGGTRHIVCVGGGGGGYGKDIFTAQTGTYQIIVGEGGKVTPIGNGQVTSVDGGTSSFIGTGISISATGGTNGAITTRYGGPPGIGGSSTAQFSVSGSNGEVSDSASANKPYLMVGGDAGNGGSGESSNTLAIAPGGGSACDKKGAIGRVVVQW